MPKRTQQNVLRASISPLQWHFGKVTLNICGEKSRGDNPELRREKSVPPASHPNMRFIYTGMNSEYLFGSSATFLLILVMNKPGSFIFIPGRYAPNLEYDGRNVVRVMRKSSSIWVT